MIHPETRAEIRRLFFAEHFRVHAIAAHLGVHRDVVHRAIERDQMLASPAIRKSKLDPYLSFVEEVLLEYPKIRATRLFLMLRDRGYTGSAQQLRRLVARLRPRQARAFLAVTHLPGEHGQVDWGSFGTLTVGRARRKLSCFVLTLAHSRRMFARFFLDQRLESFLAAHVRAFEDIGGVPRVLMYDNLKSAVLERVGSAIKFHPALLELAGHYHFRPHACTPASGWEKGGVEAGVRYIRSSYAEARVYRDLDDANAQLRRWLDEVANRRPWPPDRTRCVPEVYDEEAPFLLPLAAHEPPTAALHTLRSGKQPYLRFDLNDYSIPHTLVGRNLSLLATEDTVRVLDGVTEVALHKRSWDRGKRIEDPAHIHGLLLRKPRAQIGHGQGRLLDKIPRLTEVFHVLAQRGENMGSNVSQLLILLDRYGEEALRDAVEEALERGTPLARSIGAVLERRRGAQNTPPAIPITLPDRASFRGLRVSTHNPATYDTLLSHKDTDHDDETP